MFVNYAHLPQEVRGLFLNGQNEVIKVRGDVKHVVKVQPYPQCFGSDHELQAREAGVVGTLISLSSNDHEHEVWKLADLNIVFVNHVASKLIYTAKGANNILTRGHFTPNCSRPEIPMCLDYKDSLDNEMSPENATQEAVAQLKRFLR